MRDWKEYLGESPLIIFSVVLALVSTEWVNKANEPKQTKEIISQVLETAAEQYSQRPTTDH